MAEEMRTDDQCSLWVRKSPIPGCLRSRKAFWKSSATSASEYTDHEHGFTGLGVGAFGGLKPSSSS